MRLCYDLEDRACLPPASAVTIGKFAAVHVGHQALIRATCAAATRLGAASVVLTFDRDPQEVLRPGPQQPALTTLDERLRLIEALGVEVAVVVRLDLQFLGQTPEEFVQRVLLERLHAVEVVASGNFRFGRGAAGTMETLETLGARHGFGVTIIPPVVVRGEPVSSSRVAACVEAGDVETAAVMLGRPYSLSGPVLPGDRLGRQLGFPTANLAADPARLLPANGVYSGFAAWNGERRAAVTNVGVRPTVDGARRLVEAHLLDFQGDLYGVPLTFEFHHRLRGEERFPSLEALKAQIERDVEEARRRLGARHGPPGVETPGYPAETC
jgi:riboflavin kinase/FMN adenylyltransferase